MAYVNPIPAIGVGKDFELRLGMKFDMLVPVDEAKRQCAEFILSQDRDTVAGWLVCSAVRALYPKDLTADERAFLEAGTEKPDGDYPSLRPDRKDAENNGDGGA